MPGGATARRTSVIVGAWLLVVMCAGAADARAAPDHQLAADYRPLLKFDRDERWRPLEITSFLRESAVAPAPHRICPSTVVCDRVAGNPSELLSGSILDVAGEGRDGRGYRTPIAARCARTAPVVDCDTGSRSVMYYTMKRAGNRVVIDYWWFFRYNDYPNDNELKCRHLILCHDHEGDWEGIRVLLTTDRPRDIEVRFDAHGRSERYGRLPPERIGGHPVVYVALGTHASYPRPCVMNFCRQTGAALPDGRYDGHRPWGRNAAGNCRRGSCLRPLAQRGWATWPGRWGRGCASGCVREPGPTSPGLQARARVRSSPRARFDAISQRTAYRLVIRHVLGR